MTAHPVAESLRALADLIDTDPTFGRIAAYVHNRDANDATPFYFSFIVPFDMDPVQTFALAAVAAHDAGFTVENDDTEKHPGIRVGMNGVWLRIFCGRDKFEASVEAAAEAVSEP